MDAISRRFAVYEAVFADQLPSLSRHFLTLGVRPDMYLLNWLLTLYTKSLPLDLATRIWDCYFIQGESFIVRSALGLLRFFSPQLEGASFDDVMCLVTNLPQEGLEQDDVFAAIDSIKLTSEGYEKMLKAYGASTR